MMKMLVELDENKVLSEGKYSLDKMNSYGRLKCQNLYMLE